MEKEFKFYLPADLRAAEIILSDFWKQWTHTPWIEIHMQANYYETELYDLSAHGIVIRSRSEGDKTVLTIKAPGSTEGTYSERLEWNYLWTDKHPLLSEVIELLKKESEATAVVDILENISAEKLHSKMGTRVTRTESHFNIENTQFVVSMDEGYLYNGSLKDICRELEVEFHEGDETVFREVSKQIQIQFDLIGDTENKFSRILALEKDETK